MSTEHPDEGTIHAWLDGALGEAESARVAAHVAGCAACQAATAEARGLIAGASRVVRALDGAGSQSAGPAWGGAAPAASASAGAGEGSLWRALRVTPARAAIAATLLVAAGLTLTHDWAAQDSALLPPPAARSPAATSPAVRVPALSAAKPAAERDPLLDSAVRRNVAQALPPRTLTRAPGPDIPVAPAVASATTVDSTAGLRVAEARASVRATRDSAPPAADRSVAGLAAAASEPAVLERGAATTTTTTRKVSARRAAPMAASAATGQAEGSPAVRCLRINATTPGERFGPFVLPINVTLNDGGPREVVLMGPGSVDSHAIGTWRPLSSDSMIVTIGSAHRTIAWAPTVDCR